MSKTEMVWIDEERCTGCGACVEACPVGAIALVDDVARVDEETCTGCGACLEVCPVEAIQPVVRGEIVPAEERGVTPRRTADEPLARPTGRSRELAETAAPVAVALGLGLLTRAADALAWVVNRWLAERSEERTTPSASATDRATEAPGRGNGGGRRTRRRHRGG
ncbi:MAG: indolepyruvate ferredoxin oxidoreductase subunit alpha [Chloroflexota bacterium]